MQSLLAGIVLAMTGGGAAAQAKWDMPTGYAVGSFQTENVQQFANEVEKASGGKLKIQLHPNGSLFKANEIKRAVQSGQADAGEFILSGAANENPVFGVDSVPFLATSYDGARKLWRASKANIEALLAKQGMKLLFVAPWPPQSLYTQKPVAAGADLRGTKMRAYNPATSRIAQLLGAQPTTIQLAELSQAIATGAVDNFLTSSASGIENKLYEQMKYFYSVNAWLPKNAIVVNQKAFAKLDKPLQDAVLAAAAAAEERGWKVSEEKNKAYLAELGQKGMQVNAPGEALRKDLVAVGETMTAEWIKTAGDEGKAIVDAFRKP